MTADWLLWVFAPLMFPFEHLISTKVFHELRKFPGLKECNFFGLIQYGNAVFCKPFQDIYNLKNNEMQGTAIELQYTEFQ